MKQRFSVARCCCTKPQQPPAETTTVLADWWGYWYDNPNNTFVENFGIGNIGLPVYSFRWGGQILNYNIGQSDEPFETSGHVVFNAVDVPQGVTLTNAVMKFPGTNASQYAARDWWEFTPGDLETVLEFDPQPYVATCDIAAHDDDDGGGVPTYSTVPEMEALPRTTEKVLNHTKQFELIDDGGDGNSDRIVYENEPAAEWPDIDITAVVQEIVSRPGWTTGNRMRLLFDTTNYTVGTFNIGSPTRTYYLVPGDLFYPLFIDQRITLEISWS